MHGRLDNSCLYNCAFNVVIENKYLQSIFTNTICTTECVIFRRQGNHDELRILSLMFLLSQQTYTVQKRVSSWWILYFVSKLKYIKVYCNHLHLDWFLDGYMVGGFRSPRWEIKGQKIHAYRQNHVTYFWTPVVASFPMNY